MAQLLDRERLLEHLRGDDERKIGARVVDLAEQAIRQGEPVATDFLDPFQHQVSTGILGSIPEISYRAYGGYPKAERRRLLIFPHYYLVELLEEPIAALDIRVKSNFDNPGHRDFLGSLTSTGLSRDKLGDLIVTESGCQAIVAVDVVDFLRLHLDRVGKSPVDVEVIDVDRLDVEPERVKEIKTTVASLRLDAVASSGFGTSRTKMARDIKAERVKLNWAPVTNPAQEVQVGDTLSMRGRGRVVVEEVTGKTRKGRISLLLKRLQ